MSGFPILSFLIFLPVVGALAIYLMAKQSEALAKNIALGVTGLVTLGSVGVFTQFDSTVKGFQFSEKLPWIPSFNINYALGVDGVSVLLVLLTGLLGLVSLGVALVTVKGRLNEYLIQFLILLGASMGVFVALDLFLFYVFWEAMLIPAYLLIGMWGGEKRLYATMKFFLYTLASSLIMLVGIIALYVLGGNTADMVQLASTPFSSAVQFWAFLAFFIAFAVKAPIFPFHTWLPDTYVEAPTAVTILLAGVLSKMGAYGLIRFCLTYFPDASHTLAPIVVALSVIAILYGAIVAVMQTDVKRMVAYSSFSHIGFITLGIFSLNSQGIGGAVIQMFNHGVIIAGLFALVAYIAYRTGTSRIAEMSGLARVMPWAAVAMMLFVMASVGLPGLNGFVGEFLILLGAFLYSKPMAVLATLGIVFGVVYILWMYHNTLWGVIKKAEHEQLKDLSFKEIAILLPLALLVIWIGVYPSTFLAPIQMSVQDLSAMVGAHSALNVVLDNMSIKIGL